MKLLVTGKFGADERILGSLRDAGHEVLPLADERADLPDDVGEVEGVICNALFLYHGLELFPNLKMVQVTSAGLDRVPVKALDRLKVPVFSARGVYKVPVAEWVVLQILQVAKQARFFCRNQETKRWEKSYDLSEIAGCTACIIGFGEVGKEVAKRLLAFDVGVVAVTLHPAPSPLARSVVGVNRLAEVLPDADIIVLTVPLTPETRHLIDEHALQLMRPDSVLVNVARGEVIDEVALISALEAGRFSGVALDVFEDEPLQSASPLWGFERVLLTPHNSYASSRNTVRLLECVLRNLTQVETTTHPKVG